MNSAISNLFHLKKLTLQRNPLNKAAYDIYIPKIKDNNPSIVLYHDGTLTPEKSLYLAQKYSFLGIIFVIVVGVVILLAIRKKLVTRKNKESGETK